MTSLPGAPAMTTLVGAIHQDVRHAAVTVAARPPVVTVVVDPPGIGESATTGVLRVVGPVGLTVAVTVAVTGDRIVAPIVVLVAGLSARGSGAARC